MHYQTTLKRAQQVHSTFDYNKRDVHISNFKIQLIDHIF